MLTDTITIPGFAGIRSADSGAGTLFHGRSVVSDQAVRIWILPLNREDDDLLRSVVRLRKAQSEGLRGSLPIVQVGALDPVHLYAVVAAPGASAANRFGRGGFSEAEAVAITAQVAEAMAAAHAEQWAFGGLDLGDISLDQSGVPRIDILTGASKEAIGPLGGSFPKRAHEDVAALGALLRALTAGGETPSSEVNHLMGAAKQPGQLTAESFALGLHLIHSSARPEAGPYASRPAVPRRPPTEPTLDLRENPEAAAVSDSAPGKRSASANVGLSPQPLADGGRSRRDQMWVVAAAVLAAVAVVSFLFFRSTVQETSIGDPDLPVYDGTSATMYWSVTRCSTSEIRLSGPGYDNELVGLPSSNIQCAFVHPLHLGPPDVELESESQYEVSFVAAAGRDRFVNTFSFTTASGSQRIEETNWSGLTELAMTDSGDPVLTMALPAEAEVRLQMNDTVASVTLGPTSSRVKLVELFSDELVSGESYQLSVLVGASEIGQPFLFEMP